MRRIRPIPALLLLALPLFLPAFAALAQEDRSAPPTDPDAGSAPSPLPGIFGEVLDVRVINLEVVVTDKQGTQILGLSPSDFRLLVDGEEVPVDYFSEVRGGVALAARAKDPEASVELPGVPALTPGEPVETSYLVFIDDFFSIPGDRNAVLRSLKDDLAFLRPEDRMAIVAYDGSELEMLSSWSSLQRPLERALDDAMARPSKGLQRIVERRRYDFLDFDQIGFGSINDPAFGSGAFGGTLDPDERAYVSLLTDQLNNSIAAASATLRSFAKPPGRKVMLLLSGGWPFVPADYLTRDASRVLFDRGGPYGSNLYRRLVETANVLGYTIYPVDLPGLDREIVDVDRIDRSAARQPAILSAPGFLREAEVHDTLEYLARETGGRALINAARLGAFQRVAEDVDSYYWLGFTPQRAQDDQTHEVEVVVKNPEFEVRTRGSYLDSSREREVSMAVESTLLFGNAAAAGKVRVELGEPVKVARKRMELPIRVSIPLDEVTVLAVGDRFAAQLELRFAVQDDSGQQAPIPVIPWNLVLREPPREGAVTSFTTRLLLRTTSHEAVVAVHDPASGKIFSTGFEIQPLDN